MESRISLAESPQQIRCCFQVVSQLRTHLDEGDFVAQVQRQQVQGYRLAFVENSSGVQAVAGFRFLETLAWGKIFYVDDLVTNEQSRSHGFGRTLFDWLLQRARSESCDQLHLDSGVQRFDAHRFYLARRMAITSHHFAISLR